MTNRFNVYQRAGIPEPIRTAGQWASLEDADGPLVRTVAVAEPSRRAGTSTTAVVGSQSTRIGPTSSSYDPTRPSYAQPFRQTRREPEPEPDQVEEEADVSHVDVIGEGYRAFPDVFPADKPFLQPAQDNLILNPVPIYISIDSRDRNRNVYPGTNYYRVPLVSSSTNPDVKTTGDRIKNVYSVSLLSCVVPNAPHVFDQPYLLLQIDEIDGIYDSANAPTTKAITKLYFREAFSGSTFLRLDKGVGDPTARIYWPAPKASLEHLTVSFRNYDGTLFDFGADTTPPTDPNTELQTTLTLEIRTYVVDTIDTIGHRNPN